MSRSGGICVISHIVCPAPTSCFIISERSLPNSLLAFPGESPPPRLHRLPVSLFFSPTSIICRQPAGVSGWHLSAGNGGYQSSRFKQSLMLLNILFLVAVSRLHRYATAANFLWRGDSCQEKWDYSTNGRLISFLASSPTQTFGPCFFKVAT